MSILSKGIGKDPINTQEPFSNEQELRENLNMQSPPPSEAPNDWKSNTLDMGSVSPSIGARALGGLIRKAVDFVPNTFDPDNENRNYALAGLSFLGPSNFLTGQSAWNAGVGSLQAMFDEQAKTARETSRQASEESLEGLRQDRLDARERDKEKFKKGESELDRASRKWIAENRTNAIKLAARYGADADVVKEKLKIDEARRKDNLDRQRDISDKDRARGYVVVDKGGVPARSSLEEYEFSLLRLTDLLYDADGKEKNLPPDIKSMFAVELEKLSRAQANQTEWIPDVAYADYMKKWSTDVAELIAENTPDYGSPN